MSKWQHISNTTLISVRDTLLELLTIKGKLQEHTAKMLNEIVNELENRGIK
jgi:hypothetical protein